jgi:hypothetical protein
MWRHTDSFLTAQISRYTRKALETVASEKPNGVRLVVYDSSEFKKVTTSQFRARFRQILKDPKFAEYCKDVGGRPPTNFDEFETVLQEQEDLTRDRFMKAGITIREVSETIPVFAWLRDGDEAIMSIYSLGASPLEQSFRTREPSFVAMVDQIIRDAVSVGKLYGQ